MANDFRYALRTLARDRSFALIAILALALGIGANTAIFSVINSVLLRPLLYKDPDRLIVIRETLGPLKHLYPILPCNAGHMLEWRKQCSSCEQITAIRSIRLNLTGAGDPELIGAARVSANLFALLGVQPKHGRTFLDEEDQRGRDRVAIITDSLWKRRFNSDPALVGRTITLDGHPYLVAGVLPPDFRFPRNDQLSGLSTLEPRTEIFKPLGLTPDEISSPGEFNYVVLGRLKPGATIERALAEINAAQAAIGATRSVELTASALTLQDQLVGNSRAGLLLLLAAVGVVLLIICVNLANLLLARSAARTREVAIRTALGATSLRLARQLLTESLAVSLIGGGLGIALAFWGLAILIRSAPVDLPRLDEIRLDLRVLSFGFGITLLTGLLFGLLPALRLARAAPIDALKSGSHTTTTSKSGVRLRAVLVSMQVGLSVVLLVTAGLLISSFARLMNVDKGFPTDRLLAIDIVVPLTKYPDQPGRTAFLDRVITGASSVPGVQLAGIVSALPLEGESWVDVISVPGETRTEVERPLANYRFVSPAYFATIGIPLRSGRLLEESDRKNTAVLISELTARRLWPNENPLGKRFRRGNPKDPLFEVVGVVGDVRSSLQKEPVPTVYVPYWTLARSKFTLVLRTASDPRSIIAGLREEFRRIDPEVPLAQVRTLEQVISGSLGQRRFQMLLIVLFAAAALVLACLGIYGVVSYTVGLRRSEMAIRMALGATAADLHRMILSQGLGPVIVGLAAGVAAALAVGRVLGSLLFQVHPTDPITYSSVIAILLAVAGLACYFPARRAVRLDTATVLRYE